MTERSFAYNPAPMKVELLSCPVQASLKILGREWAFLVLTSIALFRAQRFNDLLRAMLGLPKRLLTMRLKELEKAGFIIRAETRRGYVRWELTEKGADVVPILLTLVQFGSKWYADEIFTDKKVRTLDDIFDEAHIRRTLGLSRKEHRIEETLDTARDLNSWDRAPRPGFVQFVRGVSGLIVKMRLLAETYDLVQDTDMVSPIFRLCKHFV
ncbi:MAG: winged helix-turn-helix transcriptional regulator [Nitrososphaerales archaeon]